MMNGLTQKYENGSLAGVAGRARSQQKVWLSGKNLQFRIARYNNN